MLRRKESRAQELKELEQEARDSDCQSKENDVGTIPNLTSLELRRQKSKEKDGRCQISAFV